MDYSIEAHASPIITQAASIAAKEVSVPIPDPIDSLPTDRDPVLGAVDHDRWFKINHSDI